MKRLEEPRGLVVNFAPSERQYELWNALQPNRCDKCGGELEMRECGTDKDGHVLYEPVCKNCGNNDIPEQILSGGSAGGGKALSINTLLISPKGLLKLKDIKIGDIITNPNTGYGQTVTAIHPWGKHDFYRVYFSDGTNIECSEGHLWKTLLDGDDYPFPIMAVFLQTYLKHCRVSIPLCKPVIWSGKSDDIRFAPVGVRKKYLHNKLHTKGLWSCKRNGDVILHECLSKSDAEKLSFVARSLGMFSRVFHFGELLLIYVDTKATTKDIIRVEPIGEQESFCITVSDDSGLYCTNDFTVTHNSYLGSAWLVSSCIRFPKISMVVARKELKVLKATTWKTIKNIMDEWKLEEDVNYHINNADGVITFWNGSTISQLDLAPQPSDPDYNNLGSLEITGAFIDEVAEISEKAVEVLASRIRYRIAETFVVGKILMSCNPTLNWPRRTFVQDDDGLPVRLPKGYRFIRFSLFDNPDEKFRAIYFNKLSKIRDKATRLRLLYGNWDFVDGNTMAAYWSFDGEKHLVQNLKEKSYDPLRPLILSFDFNVAPYMSCLPMQFDFTNKRIYVFPEFIGRPKDLKLNTPAYNNTPAFTKYIRHVIMSREWNQQGGVLVTGDPAGLARSTQTEDGVNNFTIALKNLNEPILRPVLKLLSKQPAMKTRLEFINELFDGYHGWQIFIDLRCRRLTDDLVYQKKNADGTKEKKKVVDENGNKVERYGHLSDCFDYSIVYFLSDEYAKYRSGEVEAVTTVEYGTVVYGDFDY